MGTFLAIAFGIPAGVILTNFITYPGKVFKRDDSDDPNGSRSGLAVVTDHKTGCQYLVTPFGGITPRVY